MRRLPKGNENFEVFFKSVLCVKNHGFIKLT